MFKRTAKLSKEHLIFHDAILKTIINVDVYIATHFRSKPNLIRSVKLLSLYLDAFAAIVKFDIAKQLKF